MARVNKEHSQAVVRRGLPSSADVDSAPGTFQHSVVEQPPQVLTREPPEKLMERCRDMIEQNAPPGEKENLLAGTSSRFWRPGLELFLENWPTKSSPWPTRTNARNWCKRPLPAPIWTRSATRSTGAKPRFFARGIATVQAARRLGSARITFWSELAVHAVVDDQTDMEFEPRSAAISRTPRVPVTTKPAFLAIVSAGRSSMSTASA